MTSSQNWGKLPGMNWKTWLEQFYRVGDERGKMYPNRHQLAMAISGGHNANAVTELELKGPTTIERLLEVAQATEVNPVRILLEMGVVSEDDIEAMGIPQVATVEQGKALKIVAELEPLYQKAWLESGEELLLSHRRRVQ